MRFTNHDADYVAPDLDSFPVVDNPSDEDVVTAIAVLNGWLATKLDDHRTIRDMEAKDPNTGTSRTVGELWDGVQYLALAVIDA